MNRFLRSPAGALKTSLSCCRCMALTHHGYCGPTPSLRDGRSPRSFVHASNPSSSALAAASPLVNPRTFRRCFRWLLRSRARVWAGGGLYRREAPSPNRAQAASHPPRNDDARDGTSRPVASRAYHERPTVHLFEGIVPLLEPRLGGAGRPGDGCSAWPSQWEWRNIFGSPPHSGSGEIFSGLPLTSGPPSTSLPLRKTSRRTRRAWSISDRCAKGCQSRPGGVAGCPRACYRSIA